MNYSQTKKIYQNGKSRYIDCSRKSHVWSDSESAAYHELKVENPVCWLHAYCKNYFSDSEKMSSILDPSIRGGIACIYFQV